MSDTEKVVGAPTLTIQIRRDGQTSLHWAIDDDEAMPRNITDMLAIVGAAHIAVQEVQKQMFEVARAVVKEETPKILTPDILDPTKRLN